MKHSNSILALFALTMASDNNSSPLFVDAKRERNNARKKIKTQQVDIDSSPTTDEPTASPSYNPTTEWPTYVPTSVPTESPSESPIKPPVPPITPPPLNLNGIVIAVDDEITLPAGTTEAFVGVLENDTGSNLVVRDITSPATVGTCSISISLAEVVYTLPPATAGFIGSDSCEYQACDAPDDDCDTATLTIIVKEDSTYAPTPANIIRPTPAPTEQSGTEQTVAPTSVSTRPETNAPTQPPITPFPTEPSGPVVTVDPTPAPTEPSKPPAPYGYPDEEMKIMKSLGSSKSSKDTGTATYATKGSKSTKGTTAKSYDDDYKATMKSSKSMKTSYGGAKTKHSSGKSSSSSTTTYGSSSGSSSGKARKVRRKNLRR